NMQAMVAAREISQRQAIGFDIEYTAQLAGEEQRRLETALDGDAETLVDKMQLYQELADLSLRYTARLADDQRKWAEAGRREADRFAQPFREAFDEIGTGLRAAAAGLLAGTETARTASVQVMRAVEGGVVGMITGAISKAGAGPLADLLGIN